MILRMSSLPAPSPTKSVAMPRHWDRGPASGRSRANRARPFARREPLLRLLPEFATEIAQPSSAPTLRHRAKQRTVGSRKNARDLRRELVALRPGGHRTHERGTWSSSIKNRMRSDFVRKLEVERSDPHAGRPGKSRERSLVAGLTKRWCVPAARRRARFSQGDAAPARRSVGQSTGMVCRRTTTTQRFVSSPSIWEGAVPLGARAM